MLIERQPMEIKSQNTKQDEKKPKLKGAMRTIDLGAPKEKPKHGIGGVKNGIRRGPYKRR